MNKGETGQNTHPRTKILTLPLLNRGIRIKVTQILEIEALVLAVQLHRSFFALGRSLRCRR